ncbi:hypothetical protein BX600DRAFT_108594 [Xylariales sp. PMI_506]|nr:hypothetical protein BX600DRAFT_108594 [Xylariales sp. PMI_506]
MDEDVAQFLAITGSDNEQVARGYLEISNGDSMQAIQLFFDSPELATGFASSANAATPTARQPTSTTRAGTSRGALGREEAGGIITIDSDEDDNDIEMSQTDDDHIVIPDDDEDEDQEVAAVARAAQEEDDAAMARRLQEEIYSQGPASPGGVRAPMGRTTETLIAPDPSWGLEDDREAAVLDQLRRRRQQPARSANPFSQSVWDDSGPPGGGSPGGGPPIIPPISDFGTGTSSRSQRLADLFRPPWDLISPFTWDDARQEGKDEKKWIIVNVQDMSDFNCQALNRDHWKDEKIRALIQEHFIFMQYEKDSPRAQDYINFYFGQGHEDPNNYPYVAIIDPRTGEQVKLWSGLPFPTTDELHSDLVEFLDRYSLAANSKNPVSKAKAKAKTVDYGRLTEEEMLEMALKNSLEANGSSSRPTVHDPDELTKSNPDIGMGAAPAPPLSLPAAEISPFIQISSTSPHVEPENSPSSTTRIQFRHPAGRVIRRFSVADPVRRIYEWLKAEPLEGKEGVPFELKAQPGGDLIDKLDTTIEDAGLKQGTVMIEFIEDE